LWPIAPFFFYVGMVLAHASFSTLSIIELVLLTFPLNFLMYGVNDVFDYQSDLKNERKKEANLGEGIVLPQNLHASVMIFAYCMGVLLLCSSLLTQNFENILIMISFLAIVFLYSVPPIRLKTRPPLDSLSNSLYVLGPALLGFSFGGSIFNLPISILIFSLCVVGIHALSTIMDYSADSAVGDRTMATVLGVKGTALVSMAIFSLVLWFSMHITPLSYTTFVIACLSLVVAVIEYIKPSERLARMFCYAVFITFLFSISVYILKTSF
jgi:4-hydroxybenzoate polyprenyltransferase